MKRVLTMVVLFALVCVSSTWASGAQEEPDSSEVVLTVWGDAFEKSFPSGVQDDLVAREIARRTGVIMDLTPMNAVSNYNEKLAAALAANDLPDVAIVTDANMLPKIVSSRAALALDPYLEEHAPTYSTVTPRRLDYARTILGRDMDGNTDGSVYFLTLRGDFSLDPLQAQVAPYLRYDLWQELGYPDLKTMDDYIEVLQQMKELEPENADGRSTYGVSAWFADAPGWNDWVFNAVFGMFEGVAMIGEHIMVDIENYEPDSKVLNADSPFWHGVEWFNKAHRAGVLDPDAFIMKWDNFLEKAAGNRVFLGWAPWMMDGGNTAFTAEGEVGRGYVQMPAPTQSNRYMLSFDNPVGALPYMVSRRSQHPGKAVEFLDFLNSYDGAMLLYNGVQGEHWDLKDGRPYVFPDVIEALASEPDYRITSGVYKYHNLAGRGHSATHPEYGVPVYLQFLPEVVEQRLSPLQREAADHFDVRLPGDLYLKNDDLEYTNSDNSVSIGMPQKPDDIREIDAKIFNYIQANQFKIVLSETPEEFEAAKQSFIEDCRQIGAERSLEWFRTEFAKLESRRQ